MTGHPTSTSAFDEQLRTRIRATLSSWQVESHPSDDLKHAAVCLALVPSEDGQAALTLCLRGRVGSHQHQFALPGGRVDHGELPAQAALRELDEEVALQGEVLGQLDDYVTRSGFHISPFVVWCPDQQPVVASPDEIAAVYAIPLTELTRADSPRWMDIPESDRPVLQLPILEHLIHAPTAAYLYQFAEVVLRGRATRVQGVEEPVFAWR